jgi:AcrR family transcriptional regulator
MTATVQRWQRRKDARPSEILEAALIVFAEKGFAATRMEDIAAKAGVTKGTIYLYFPGKEAVFKSLVRQAIGSNIATISAMVRHFSGAARDLLRVVLGQMGEMVRTNDRFVLVKIILAESGNFPELARFWRDEIIAHGLTLLGGVIEKGIANGEFRAIEPQHAARLCVAPLLLVGLWRTTFEKFDTEPYDYQGLIDAHVETLLKGMAA